jgi:hypothetical protein
MSSCTVLVPQNVECETDESVGDQDIGPRRRLDGKAAKLLGESESPSIVAGMEASEIESVYRCQPVPYVVRDLGKLESLCQRGVHFRAGVRVDSSQNVTTARYRRMSRGIEHRPDRDGPLDSGATFSEK